MQTDTAAPPPRPRLLTMKQAAERLAVSERSVWALIDAGELPRIVVGRRAVRIDPADLEQFIASRRGQAKPEASP